mmetsp:Transcript_20552/g.37410  ORF Transcript_20552/g.37410 Transcript_20552/m.37410 type:complete len:265 (-) Transcript_20552:207-1001(-)
MRSASAASSLDSAVPWLPLRSLCKTASSDPVGRIVLVCISLFSVASSTRESPDAEAFGDTPSVTVTSVMLPSSRLSLPSRVRGLPTPAGSDREAFSPSTWEIIAESLRDWSPANGAGAETVIGLFMTWLRTSSSREDCKDVDVAPITFARTTSSLEDPANDGASVCDADAITLFSTTSSREAGAVAGVDVLMSLLTAASSLDGAAFDEGLPMILLMVASSFTTAGAAGAPSDLEGEDPMTLFRTASSLAPAGIDAFNDGAPMTA